LVKANLFPWKRLGRWRAGLVIKRRVHQGDRAEGWRSGVRAVARSAQARKAVSRGCVGWRLRIYRDLRVRSSRVSRAADLGCRAGGAGEAAGQRGAAARAVSLRRRWGCGEDRGRRGFQAGALAFPRFLPFQLECLGSSARVRFSGVWALRVPRVFLFLFRGLWLVRL